MEIIHFINQTVEKKSINVTASSNKSGDFKYAFYVYHNGQCIFKEYYGSNNFTYNIDKLSGSLKIQVFIKDIESGYITQYFLDPIQLERTEISLNDLDPKSDMDVNVKIGEISIPLSFYKKERKKLCILFNGALTLDAQKKFYPFFNRISWRDSINASCLYLYDASLDLVDDYTLGWYRGKKDKLIHSYYVQIIKKLRDKLQLSNEDLVFYGSSGGGFASLKFSEEFIGSTSVAINAQTNILNYGDKQAVENFKNAFENNLNNVDMQINFKKFKKSGSRFIFVQNIQDEHHYTDHFLPFWGRLSHKEDGHDTLNNNHAIIYTHESGHGGEPEEVFQKIKAIADI